MTLAADPQAGSRCKIRNRSTEELKEEYPEVYLLRNEKHFAPYNFAEGQGFEPDFVLFLLKKMGGR